MKLVQRLFLLLFVLMVTIEGYSQTSTGCIIEFEGKTVYVDLSTPNVKEGDELGAYSHGGYMTDPNTGRRVRKPDELKAKMKIVSVHQGYSKACLIDDYSHTFLKKGMSVKLLKKAQVSAENKSNSNNIVAEGNNRNKQVNSDNVRSMITTPSVSYNDVNRYSVNTSKPTVVIAPAQVNDIVNSGHFGGYVADVLMEQLLMCNEVRLLDRSVLNAQIDEMELTGSVIDPQTAIERGKVAGARYIIQVTMQKPDVVNIRTGIPLASVMGAIGAATQTNIGAQYASNMQVGTLKASVTISTRVVDLQTGEILFMTSGTGNAKGKSQLSLEYGALGGAEINGGADGFKQTVTGKAIQQAFTTIGRNLKKFFAGETTNKVMGSTTGYGNYGQTMAARGMKLYVGTEKLDKEGVRMAFAENQDLYFKYKSAKRKNTWGTILAIWGVSTGLGICGIISDENPEGGYAVFGGCLVVGVGGGMYLCSKARKTVRQIVNEYNRSQSSYADVSLNLVFDKNNIGLRLTF